MEKSKTKDYKELSRVEFNREAHKFDQNNLMDIYNMCKHDYPYILKKLEEETFEKLLDVGCGTGNVITLLHEKYPSRSYTGIDLSEEMIKVAKSKEISSAFFMNGDSENLPFKNEQFDVVICTESFHHYPNPGAFFDGAQRVLKAGGRLIILDVTTWKVFRWIENRLFLPNMNMGDVHIYGRGEMENLYKKHGFKLESCESAGMMRFICCGRKM
ncbi:class I SAM-dependent methyltransferase [Clostridium oryzae]|uniref:Phthiotriol/phenolphthiotriol dimycocerosates methyltransferase n=1 Tax=Clostridium oryzae TaxID=1450648 RepID=A0A1V4IHT5_9CLOT|nr:class I SAM-dependent methyltransferase [Clostridium oryzae]OPJ59562.1 phthiotriol/phenolphthiotriol dimycocerosates methyltransferase [Clostridium oryzae]